MLIIKPIQDAALQTALCGRCGVPYRPGCLCYQAYLGEGPDDETTFVGISQFSVGEVDGERIKEDVWYTLVGGEFQEVL